MRRVSLVLALVSLTLSAGEADAQIPGRLKQRVRQAVEQAAENAVMCVVTDRACIEAAEAEGKEVTLTDESGAPLPPEQAGQQAAGPQQAAPARPGEGAWANYDFVPGDRILFDEDFTRDVVGDFPRRMEFKEGALEIVEWSGTRWLRAAADNSRFYVTLPETLPSRFTMEFDYVIPSGGEVWIYFGENTKRMLRFGAAGAAGVRNLDAGIDAHGEYEAGGDRNKIRRARVLGDGAYVKVYLDDKRILNVPNGEMERDTRILFWTDSQVDAPTLFGNFRVAAGGLRLYDALAAEGRVATQGIFFDTGADRLRPESTPTLEEIGAMLEQHPELRLLIEGHTDDVGDDAANLALSDARAAAVKAYLVENHGCEAGRLETRGFGETRPAVPDDTPEGRQQNRRVELVKL